MSAATRVTLETLSLADCPVTDTILDNDVKSLCFHFDFIFQAADGDAWDTVENAVLTVTGWTDLTVEYSDADDAWQNVPLHTLETFEDILDTEHHADHIVLSGFSAENGHWLRYRLAGADIMLQLTAQEN